MDQFSPVVDNVLRVLLVLSPHRPFFSEFFDCRLEFIGNVPCHCGVPRSVNSWVRFVLRVLYDGLNVSFFHWVRLVFAVWLILSLYTLTSPRGVVVEKL